MAGHADWMRLVRRGLAGRRCGAAMRAKLDLFWLTRAGAEAVLLPGETLDPEDFPPPRPSLEGGL